MHYPKCVVWQGLRADNSLGNNPFYTYERSAESADNLPATVTTGEFADIYAETPLGDYVNQFYTDTNFLIPYKPAIAEKPFINFRLKLNTVDPDLSVNYQWSTEYGSIATPPPLQWTAGFDIVTGNKMIDIDSAFPKARQSSEQIPEYGTSVINGTARIKNNQ